MSDNGKTSSQDKRAAVESFMAIGMVMLHLDARVPGVRVPSRLQNEFQLRLNISPRFSPPDLEIDDWGIHQTLSFGGSPFPVAVPWVAIYGLSNVLGEMRLYPQAMPDELFEAVSLSQGKTREELAQELKTRQRDDGKSPTPVLTFKPVAAPPKPPVPPPPSPARHAAPTSPGPAMMRRKGGLALVAPPPEDAEEEASASPDKAASGDAAAPAPERRVRKAKASPAGKKAASAKATDAKKKKEKAAPKGKKKAAEGAGAEDGGASPKPSKRKTPAKAGAGEGKGAARKKATLERPGDDETSPEPPETPPRKPFTLRIVK